MTTRSPNKGLCHSAGPLGSGVVRYAIRIAAAVPPLREPIHFVSNAMFWKLGQLSQFRCPSHRDGIRRRNISQVANSLQTSIWNESRCCTNTFSVSTTLHKPQGSLRRRRGNKNGLSLRAIRYRCMYSRSCSTFICHAIYFVRLGVAYVLYILFMYI